MVWNGFTAMKKILPMLKPPCRLWSIRLWSMVLLCVGTSGVASAAEPVFAPFAPRVSQQPTYSAPTAPTPQSPRLIQPTPVQPGFAPVSPAPQIQPVPQMPAYQVVGPQPGQAVPYNDCDYWIVSSRQCRKRDAYGGADCCLRYYHRQSEQCLADSDRQTFFANMRPDRPVCFVIHGSYNRWGDVVTESKLIHEWLRAAAPQLPIQVVFFTWPSDGNMPFILTIDLAILGRRSAYHGMFLAELIGQIPPEQPISILGHSHGARTAMATLHLLGGGCIEKGHHLPNGPGYPHRIQAVLAAAAVDHHWMVPGERYGQTLLPVERLLILRNSRDFTLSFYPLRKPFSPTALGREGLSMDDRMGLGDLNAKLVDMDCAPIAGRGHAWRDYYTHPELATAVVPFVYFQNMDASNGYTAPGGGPIIFQAPPAYQVPQMPANQMPANQAPPEYQPSTYQVPPTSRQTIVPSSGTRPASGHPAARRRVIVPMSATRSAPPAAPLAPHRSRHTTIEESQQR